MIRQGVVVGLLAGLLASMSVLADTGTRIGFVNIEAVLFESKTGIQFKADIEKLKKDKSTALRKEGEKLNQMKEQFEKEMMTLTDAQKLERQKAYQEKFQAFQKNNMSAENELRQKQEEYQKTSIEATRSIASDIAKAEKLSAVFVTGAALYMDNSLDITQKVSEKFDSRPARK